MDSTTIDHSGSVVLRGVLATLFGIAAVFWPDLTLTTLVYLFSAYILVSGLIDLVFGVGRLFGSDRAVLSRFLAVIGGLIEIGVGVYLIRHPAVTFATFILLIAFALIARGLFEIVEGLFEEGPSFHRLIMILVGLVAILAGIVVLFQPESAGIAFVWILGLYALITGPLLIALGMHLHKMHTPARVPVHKV